MKKISLFVFFLIFLGGQISVVSAAEIEKTCRYSGMDNENKIYEVYIDIYDDGNVESYIKQYADKVESGNGGKGNNEDAQHWDLVEDDYESTGSCPSLVVVNNKLFGYNVYVGNRNADFEGISGIMLYEDNSFVDVIAVCHYQTPKESGLDLDFSVSLRYDGTLVYSPEHGYTPPSMSVPLVYNFNVRTFYDSVYNNGILGTCPTLSLCVDYGTGFHIQDQVYCATTGENGYLLRGDLDNVSDTPEKEDLSQSFCTNRKMSTRTRGDFYFSFGLNANGEKIWSVTSPNGTSSGDTLYNMDITVGNAIFSVDSSLYDVLWDENNSCNTTPLWFRNPYSDQIKYILVDEAPDPSENGTVDNWDGHDTEPDEQDNQGFHSNDLCTGEDCNISLAKFCNDGKVARTFKFIGLMFFVAKILVPAIVIIVGIVDLVKVITSGKEEEMKKHVKNLGIRVIIGVLIFLLPSIINAIYGVASDLVSDGGTSAFDNCEACLMTPNSSACYIEENED